MTFEDIRFALKAMGVDPEFSEKLIQYCRKNGTDYEKLDDMLTAEGYDKIFTDEVYGWADNDGDEDDYEYSQKMSTKRLWDD